MVEWNSVAPPPVTTWALSGSSGHGRQWNLPSTRRWKCDLFKSSHWWMVVQVGFLTRLISRVRKKRVPFVPRAKVAGNDETPWGAHFAFWRRSPKVWERYYGGREEKPRGTRGTVRYSSECGWTQFVVTSKQRNDNKHHRKKSYHLSKKNMPLDEVHKRRNCRKGGSRYA